MLGCFPIPPIRQRQAAGPLIIDPPQFLSRECSEPNLDSSAFPEQTRHKRDGLDVPNWSCEDLGAKTAQSRIARV